MSALFVALMVFGLCQASAAGYTIGGSQVDSCPAGSQVVATLQECRDAQTALGLGWYKIGSQQGACTVIRNRPNRPSLNGKLYFGPIGASSQNTLAWHLLICKYVPTPEPTAVPTEIPSEVPTQTPSQVPSTSPTEVPTQKPSAVPTTDPTDYCECLTVNSTDINAFSGDYADTFDPFKGNNKWATEEVAGKHKEIFWLDDASFDGYWVIRGLNDDELAAFDEPVGQHDGLPPMGIHTWTVFVSGPNPEFNAKISIICGTCSPTPSETAPSVLPTPNVENPGRRRILHSSEVEELPAPTLELRA